MEELYSLEPFSLNKHDKNRMLCPKYNELTGHHYQNCNPYRRVIDGIFGQPGVAGHIEDIPFIPVRLFKNHDLLSVPKEQITRTVLSSGTSGQVSSRIYLDKQTAMWQQKVLTKIVGDFIGKSRMPMLVADCPDVVKDRTVFSTRGSGILGFSTFGTKREFVLNPDMTLNTGVLERFLKDVGKGRFLVFGFTFIIWKHLLLELEKAPGKYDLSNGVMVHGGGWKKLLSEAVSGKEFRQRLKDACFLTDVHENYGMAEQTGSIFVECGCGRLHASIFSDVIMRDPLTMKPVRHGEKGIMQVMSVIPRSYPGHSLLTEDEGIIEGEDDCPCGRAGKYFRIIGRLKDAELRGCSDTYAAGICE